MSSGTQQDDGGSKRDKGKRREDEVKNTQQMRPPAIPPQDQLHVDSSNRSLFAPNIMPRRRSPGWRERSNINPAGPFAFESVQTNTKSLGKDTRGTEKTKRKSINPNLEHLGPAKRKRATSKVKNDPGKTSASTSNSTSKRHKKPTSDEIAQDGNSLQHSNVQKNDAASLAVDRSLDTATALLELSRPQQPPSSLASVHVPEDTIGPTKKTKSQPNSSIPTRIPENCTLASSQQPRHQEPDSSLASIILPEDRTPAQTLPKRPEPPNQTESRTSISDRAHSPRRGSQQRDTVPSHRASTQDDSISLESGEIRSSPFGVSSSHAPARDNYRHLGPYRVSTHRDPARYNSERPELRRYQSRDGFSSNHTPSRFVTGHLGPYAVSLPHSERREPRQHHLADKDSSRRPPIAQSERQEPREQSGRAIPRHFSNQPNNRSQNS